MIIDSIFVLRLTKLWQILFYPRLRRALLKHGVMGGVEHKPVLNRPLATVIDIGANRGQFALAARAITPAKIFSFEPLPGPAKTFASIFDRDDRVVLHKVAVGPSEGQCQMHISSRDDSSSILPITGLQTILFPGTDECSTIDVQIGPLDNFLNSDAIISPAILKLDVQGYEYEALCGCESLLDNITYIYCECSFVELYLGQKLASDVIEWLSARGFHLSGIYNLAVDKQKQPIQADFLFHRPKIGLAL